MQHRVSLIILLSLNVPLSFRFFTKKSGEEEELDFHGYQPAMNWKHNAKTELWYSSY